MVRQASSSGVKERRQHKEGVGMPQIRDKAEALGIKPGRMTKAELIHAIQIAEGYTPCFGRSNGECANSECCFIQDCLKVRL